MLSILALPLTAQQQNKRSDEEIRRGIDETMRTYTLAKEEVDGWRFVTESDLDLYFYKPKSLKISRSIRVAWFKDVHKIGMVRKDIPADEYKQLDLLRFDCANRKMSILSHAAYKESGEVIESGEFPADPTYLSHVIPDTTGEKMLDFVCKRSKPGR